MTYRGQGLKPELALPPLLQLLLDRPELVGVGVSDALVGSVPELYPILTRARASFRTCTSL